MSALNNFEIKTLLAHLWKDYAAMTPQAEHIRELLAERGETSKTTTLHFGHSIWSP